MKKQFQRLGVFSLGMVLWIGLVISTATATEIANHHARDREPQPMDRVERVYAKWMQNADRDALWQTWIQEDPTLALVNRESLLQNHPSFSAWEVWSLPQAMDFSKFANHLKASTHIHLEPEQHFTLDALPNDQYVDSDRNNEWDTGAWGQQHENLWGLKQIRAEDAWSTTVGSPSVVVAVIDSGIDLNHEDLEGNAWINADEIPGNGIDDDQNGFIDDVHGWDFAYGTNDPTDRYVHGTHIAGVIAARGDNLVGIAGVAWRASLMAVKAFDDTGSGSVESVIEGITYAVDEGADIINLSFSVRGTPSQLVREAVQYAKDRGALIVASGGNSGRDVGDCSTGFPEDDFGSVPACLDDVIGVGVSDRTGNLPAFSNFGEGLDLIAPGGDQNEGANQELHRNILSLKPTEHAAARELEVDDHYYRERGASLAAAHVSGALVLAKTLRPDLDPLMLRAALAKSAVQGTTGEKSFKRLDVGSLMTVLDEDATKIPEFVIDSFLVTPRTVAPGAPIQAFVTLRNVGTQNAFGVDVVLKDDQGESLHRWRLRSMPEGAVVQLEAFVMIPRRGPRTFFVEVNPSELGQLPEFYTGNNIKSRVIEGVFESRFINSIIEDDPAVQVNPDIAHRRVVWEDHRWGTPQIVSHDLFRSVTTRETFDGEYHVAPAIAAGKIAWQDLRDEPNASVNTWDIRSKQIGASEETDITSQYKAEIEVAAHRDWVVWTDSRNGLGNADIYAYRWSDGLEVQVTEDLAQQETPSVYRHSIVWEDYRSGLPQIHYKNLYTGRAFALTDGEWPKKNPRIWQTKVAYEDKRDGQWDIFIKDVRSGVETRITENPFDQFNPDITERYVVWQDAREEDWEIWLYSIAGGDVRKVTADQIDQRRPRVHGHRIVYSVVPGLDENIGLTEIVKFPSTPIHLTGKSVGGGVELEWSRHPDSFPQKYRIYRTVKGRTSWDFIAEVTESTYFDESGMLDHHHWAVTPIDSRDGEGGAALLEAP